jgi:hypothetical protein
LLLHTLLFLIRNSRCLDRKRVNRILKKIGQREIVRDSETLSLQVENAKRSIGQMKARLRLDHEEWKRQRKVPEFRHSFYVDASLTSLQESFYQHWIESWNQGKALDVEGQVGYPLLYARRVVLEKPLESAQNELIRILDSYSVSEERELRYWCSRWAADCNIALGQYRKAIDLLPSLIYDLRLSLILVTLEGLTGSDVIRMVGSSHLTDFGIQHQDEIAHHINIFLSDYEKKNGVSLLREWADRCWKGSIKLFSYTLNTTVTPIEEYSFEGSECKAEYVAIFIEMVRQAENKVREDYGVLPIGEGWVEESSLYYAIKQALPELEVSHQASPNWLGRQHLDIYIPAIAVAIEYQGIQHDQPIEFFGGEEGFKQTIERDVRKAQLCKQNGVRLLYARPGYVLENLLKQIRESE